MELELAADPDAAGNLGRLKALSGSRVGRARTQSVKVVWHDSPEHALFADGLTLAEQRGEWRLERIVPGEQTWLPGQPPPVLSTVPDRAALPAPLAPLAAFEGRRTSTVHQLGHQQGPHAGSQFGDTSLTIVVEKGVLRAVTAERPVARILLSGDDAAVRTAALLISGAIPVSVPLASLAAEGIALATGRSPAPRRKGAPVLPETSLSIADALAHILGHLTDAILANAPAAILANAPTAILANAPTAILANAPTAILANAPRAIQPDDAGSEAVHQMRVAVRRARSALAVFRPALPAGALDAVNDSLKVLGAKLGPTRDWDVFVDETMPAIKHALPADARLDRMAAAAQRRRRDCRSALATYLAGPDFRLLGIELAWFAATRTWHARPAETEATPPSLGDFAAGVLQHRWKKLLTSGKQMEDLDIQGLHGVRLRAKRTRYAAEMFATLHRGKAANRFIGRLSKVQQSLGVLNDGAVATHLLEELGGAGGRHGYAAGVVAGFMAARAERIRPRIILTFEKFRRQPIYWS